MLDRLTDKSDISETPIDWTTVDNNLERIQNESIEFINKSL